MRSTSRTRPAIASFLAVVVAFGLGACGGDSPSEPGPGPDGTRQLLITSIGDQTAGVPFGVTVTLADDQGDPVGADAASTITLRVDAGMGALHGTTSATLGVGASQVTITGVIYDHAEGGVRLRVTGSGGTAAGLSAVSGTITLDFDFNQDLLAFRRTIGSREDIYLMTADGLAFINLSDNAAVDTDPAWSPDGSRIAFVSTRSGNADLWVMNVDGTGLVQVTDDQGSVRFPNWSPDGSMIAYSANVNDQRDIYVIEAPAPSASPVASRSATVAQAIQVTDDPGTDNEPVWSPAGSEIVFFSNRDGEGAVWSIQWDGQSGSNPVRLTIDFVFACAPGLGWSLVDGRTKLSFVGETGDQLDVWVMDLDGSNARNVTNHPADDFYSTWTSDAPNPAPNGTASSANLQEARLIFDSDRDGRWQLYSILEDGTGLTRLTNYASDDEMPRWRPSAN